MNSNNYLSIMSLVVTGMFITIFLGFLEFSYFDSEACRSHLCACENPETGKDYDSGIRTFGGYCNYSDAIFWYLTNKITLIIYAGWILIGIMGYILLKKMKKNNQNKANKSLNPTPESVAALRGKFHGGAGLERR